MGYAHFCNAISDNRPRDIKSWVERYSVKEVVFYDVDFNAIVVHHKWLSDHDGQYAVIKTTKGQYAFHRELSQVVPF